MSILISPDAEAISTWTAKVNGSKSHLIQANLEAFKTWLRDPKIQKKVITLDLSNNKLTELPREINLLDRLTDLNVSNNLLTELPDELGKMRSLMGLNVSKNMLRTMPKSFNDIGTAFRKLDLSENAFVKFDELFLFYKQSMTSLNMDKCAIKRPEEFPIEDTQISVSLMEKYKRISNVREDHQAYEQTKAYLQNHFNILREYPETKLRRDKETEKNKTFVETQQLISERLLQKQEEREKKQRDVEQKAKDDALTAMKDVTWLELFADVENGFEFAKEMFDALGMEMKHVVSEKHLQENFDLFKSNIRDRGILDDIGTFMDMTKTLIFQKSYPFDKTRTKIVFKFESEST
jgi:hypothetical protein